MGQDYILWLCRPRLLRKSCVINIYLMQLKSITSFNLVRSESRDAKDLVSIDGHFCDNWFAHEGVIFFDNDWLLLSY